MGLKTYLPLAVAAFLVATVGADVFARMFIAGEPFAIALREHLHWAIVQLVGSIVLSALFVFVAFICAFVEKRAHSRSSVGIFALAMLTLLYFYFQGHLGAQHALLEEKWTAAALSIGLLPFFIGIPVVLVVAGAGALAARFDRRTSE